MGFSANFHEISTCSLVAAAAAAAAAAAVSLSEIIYFRLIINFNHEISAPCVNCLRETVRPTVCLHIYQVSHLGGCGYFVVAVSGPS